MDRFAYQKNRIFSVCRRGPRPHTAAVSASFLEGKRDV
jgi:hypothetical protein